MPPFANPSKRGLVEDLGCDLEAFHNGLVFPGTLVTLKGIDLDQSTCIIIPHEMTGERSQRSFMHSVFSLHVVRA